MSLHVDLVTKGTICIRSVWNLPISINMNTHL